MFDKVFEFAARFRTWLVNLIGAALIILPELLNAPEILALVPQSSQKWIFAAALLLNIWMRPRPAQLQSDPDVQVRNILKSTENATIVVTEAGKTMAKVEQAK